MKKCWDCFHFKTREYFNMEEVTFLFSQRKLELELEKGRRIKRPARYWRCTVGMTACEVYVLERTARLKKACKRYDG